MSKIPKGLGDKDMFKGYAEKETFETMFLSADEEPLPVIKNKIKEDLNNHPEIITEAIQTILRREGEKMPYEKLKELTRGKQITLADIHKFIDTLEVSEKIKKELKKITPENYIGLAAKL